MFDWKTDCLVMFLSFTLCGATNITFGQRRNGDNLIGSFNRPVINFVSAQYAEIEFVFPNGVANNKTISYIVVETIQSSTQGAAAIKSGGVGQKLVSLSAYSYQTYYFGATVEIYGYDNNATGGNVMRHTVGQRRKGDSLLGSFNQTLSKLPSPDNTEMRFVFPNKAANNKKISFIDFNVTQSSGQSRLVIHSGGVGQKNVSGSVYANNTLYFGVTGQVYGSAIVAKICSYLLVLSVLLTLHLMM